MTQACSLPEIKQLGFLSSVKSKIKPFDTLQSRTTIHSVCSDSSSHCFLPEVDLNSCCASLQQAVSLLERDWMLEQHTHRHSWLGFFPPFSELEQPPGHHRSVYNLYGISLFTTWSLFLLHFWLVSWLSSALRTTTRTKPSRKRSVANYWRLATEDGLVKYCDHYLDRVPPTFW